MRLFVTTCAMLALAGCSGIPVGTNSNLPQVAMKNTSGEVVPPARSYLSVPLRSFTATPGTDEGWTEISGAICTVSAGAYQAVVTTPAEVVLPDLGPDAPDLRAACRNGELAGYDVVQPDFSWPDGEKPGAFSRIGYGAGWWNGYEKSGPLSYSDLAVGMG